MRAKYFADTDTMLIELRAVPGYDVEVAVGNDFPQTDLVLEPMC